MKDFHYENISPGQVRLSAVCCGEIFVIWSLLLQRDYHSKFWDILLGGVP